VITTTSIFADLAKMALGDAAHIESIVPAGADVHTFEPSPSDVEKIQSADLIIANGLGLDSWIQSLIDAAAKGEGDTLLLGEGLDQESGWVYLSNAETPGTFDPHIWLDPKGAALYVQRIADHVSRNAPDLAQRIAATSADGITKISAIDADLAVAFAAIDPDQRKIVTMHDAFGYFARAYGIEIVGVAVASPGQDPSAQEIRALIDAIRAAGVTALFSEVQLPSKVLDQIAAETGATVLQDLYSDALGASPADSYLGVMRTNADAILGALR
jgi:ABC-type Zn uptake system ZnuABC Zn-binding protein ZnuA